MAAAVAATTTSLPHSAQLIVSRVSASTMIMTSVPRLSHHRIANTTTLCPLRRHRRRRRRQRQRQRQRQAALALESVSNRLTLFPIRSFICDNIDTRSFSNAKCLGLGRIGDGGMATMRTAIGARGQEASRRGVAFVTGGGGGGVVGFVPRSNVPTLEFVASSLCRSVGFGGGGRSSRIASSKRTTTSSTPKTEVSSTAPRSRLDEILDVFRHAWQDRHLHASFLGRIVAAVGLFHVVTEYGVDAIECEGPSMMPTIRHSGEIVLLDKCTHRIWGFYDDGGGGGGAGAGVDVGEERARRARIRQLEWEGREKERRKRNGGSSGGGDTNDNGDGQDENESGRARTTWHEPRPSPAHCPPNNSWANLRRRLLTGIAHGDVVVLQNPLRDGTVCKRVLALPGDVVVVVSRTTDRMAGAHVVGKRGTMKARGGGASTTLTVAAGQKRAEMIFEAWVDGLRRRRCRRKKRSTAKGRDEDDTKSGCESREYGVNASSSSLPFSSIEVVPDGHIWVEGDNSLESRDSREYGPVPAAMIVGRVLCRLWPFRGNALLGRGGRPLPSREGEPFGGSFVFPAGNEGEMMRDAEDCKEKEEVIGKNGKKEKKEEVME